MINKEDVDFENSSNWWISDNVFVDGDVKVRDICHITEKYRGSLDTDYNINIKYPTIIKFVLYSTT